MKNNKFNYILIFDLSNVQNMLNAIGRNVDNFSLYRWKMKNSVVKPPTFVRRIWPTHGQTLNPCPTLAKVTADFSQIFTLKIKHMFYLCHCLILTFIYYEQT